MEYVEIKVSWLNECKPFTIGEQIFVFDFKKAIDIIEITETANVQLRQKNNGNVMEWDNF